MERPPHDRAAGGTHEGLPGATHLARDAACAVRVVQDDRCRQRLLRGRGGGDLRPARSERRRQDDDLQDALDAHPRRCRHRDHRRARRARRGQQRAPVARTGDRQRAQPLLAPLGGGEPAALRHVAGAARPRGSRRGRSRDRHHRPVGYRGEDGGHVLVGHAAAFVDRTRAARTAPRAAARRTDPQSRSDLGARLPSVPARDRGAGRRMHGPARDARR